MLCVTRWALLAVVATASTVATVQADYGWDGKRHISYQQSNDLFYNEYVGPGPSGAVANLYVSPLPVPPRMGHTYVTYQPFLPHESLYHHHRSWYNHQPGAGWTRTKVRYSSFGAYLQESPFDVRSLAKHPRIVPLRM